MKKLQTEFAVYKKMISDKMGNDVLTLSESDLAEMSFHFGVITIMEALDIKDEKEILNQVLEYQKNIKEYYSRRLTEEKNKNG